MPTPRVTHIPPLLLVLFSRSCSYSKHITQHYTYIMCLKDGHKILIIIHITFTINPLHVELLTIDYTCSFEHQSLSGLYMYIYMCMYV